MAAEPAAALGVFAGNAAEIGSRQRGWFVGHFSGEPALRTNDVEIKWGVHAAGDARTEVCCSCVFVMRVTCPCSLA
jgi:hypothetical protein